jgi:hypothetical protein
MQFGPTRGLHGWFHLVGPRGLASPVWNGLTFNEMLTQLLHGRFDVSPATIGGEAFVRDGRTYAYFGIFCAFLRAPLLLFGGIRTVDMTGPSILLATAISLACRLGAASAVFSRAARSPRLSSLRTIVLLAVGFSGESMQFLAPSLFQEVVSWGDALAGGFVLILVRLVLGQTGRRRATYVGLAALAGLALLCRVSFGLGLCTALALMMGVELWMGLRRAEPWGVTLRRLAPAAGLLAVFAAAAAGVNYARWGDPFSFVPLRLQVIYHALYPDRLPRLLRYGSLNLARIPFALQYYFAPIWALVGPDGALLFQRHQLRLFEDVELPPGSLFLSDPLTCIFAVVGVGTLAARAQVFAQAALARAALVGLAIPAGLMLAAISLAFRYRMDFYPVLDFAAWLGLAAVVARHRPMGRRLVSALAVAAFVGVLVANLSALAYRISPLGPATDRNLSKGVVNLYAQLAAGKQPPFAHMMPY